MRWPILVVLLVGSSLGACTIWDVDIEPLADTVVRGRRPVYAPQDAGEIVALPPRPLVEGGTPVASGRLLYVVDIGTGVHILDNSDPAAPLALSFVQIFGVTTISVEGDRLFANNFTDLVTIDVGDPTHVRVLDRDAGLFTDEPKLPLDYRGYFECYDPSRGRLIGWEIAPLTNPRCRT